MSTNNDGRVQVGHYWLAGPPAEPTGTSASAPVPAQHPDQRATPTRSTTSRATSPEQEASIDLSRISLSTFGRRPGRPGQTPSTPAASSETSPNHQAASGASHPQPSPQRPALRLISSVPGRRESTRRPSTAQGGLAEREFPWSYWVSAMQSDGCTVTSAWIARTAPVTSTADQQAVLDYLAGVVGQPMDSIKFMSPIARPNTITGKPEVAAHENLPYSPRADTPAWRYRVRYLVDGREHSCEVDLVKPLLHGDDVVQLQNALRQTQAGSSSGGTVKLFAAADQQDAAAPQPQVGIQAFTLLSVPAPVTPAPPPLRSLP